MKQRRCKRKMQNLYLIELREQRGLNQAQLAEKLSISPSSVSTYEQGVKVPRDELKVKIAEFVGVSVLDLFYSNTAR